MGCPARYDISAIVRCEFSCISQHKISLYRVESRPKTMKVLTPGLPDVVQTRCKKKHYSANFGVVRFCFSLCVLRTAEVVAPVPIGLIFERVHGRNSRPYTHAPCPVTLRASAGPRQSKMIECSVFTVPTVVFWVNHLRSWKGFKANIRPFICRTISMGRD